MFTKKHFTHSVIFLCFLQICTVLNVELIELHDPFDADVANKLIKFLDDKLTLLPHNDVENIDSGIEKSMNEDQSANNEFPKLFNAKKENVEEVLVKRVPNEIHQSIEHDELPGYRSIIRINKKKKSTKKEINKTPNDIQYLYFIKSNKFKNANDAKPAQATNKLNKIKNNLQRNLDAEVRDEYIKSMLKYLRFMESQRKDPLRMETEPRRIALQRSGEVNVPLAPGQVDPQSKVETAPVKTKWLPNYPFWNYWTYKKTLYQDECPGNQVALGDICIWVPPH